METVLQHPLFMPLAIILVIVGVFPLVVGYIVLLERKVLADMQVRLGPMRVGPFGFLQPIADAVKLLLKEDIVPASADKWLFLAAPIISLFTAFTALSVVPFSRNVYITDVNVGLLIVSAMGAVGILGIILGGWASNSHYSLLGALRSAAQLVSYEVALSLALLNGIMVAGSLSMVEIVKAQQERGIWFVFGNFGFMVVPFIIYFIGSIAETNRAPFDLPEAESELVAGFHTEYSGFRFSLYFLSEYTNIFVVSAVAVTLFWGGWLRPFPNISWLSPLDYIVPIILLVGSGAGCIMLIRKLIDPMQKAVLAAIATVLVLMGLLFAIPVIHAQVIGPFWFFLKVFAIIYCMIWFRGTFPRFRYDQLMNIGWKWLIPMAMGAIFVNAVLGML